MPNKKFWDNSNLQGNIQWDNQTLPGLTDEELYNTNWNLKKTSKQKEKAREKNLNLINDPNWKENQKLGQQKRKQSNWSNKMLGNKNGTGNKNRLGLTNSAESNGKRSATLMGRKIPSITGVPKPKVICPHCDKEGGRPQMIQFHFDKCKFKP